MTAILQCFAAGAIGMFDQNEVQMRVSLACGAEVPVEYGAELPSQST